MRSFSYRRAWPRNRPRTKCAARDALDKCCKQSRPAALCAIFTEEVPPCIPKWKSALLFHANALDFQHIAFHGSRDSDLLLLREPRGVNESHDFGISRRVEFDD